MAKEQDQVYGGMAGLENIMQEYFAYDTTDDPNAAASKRAFAESTMQSAQSAQQAMALANQQAGLATENMESAANLDLRNKSALQTQGFNENMASMGAQYGYQSNLDSQKHDRDLVMEAAKGEQLRKNQDNESSNTRKNTIVAGEQQRLNTQLQGGIDIDRSNIAADASKYGADATKEASFRASKASENVAKTQAGASRYGAEQSRAASEYGADATREASFRSSQASENVASTQADASRDVATTQAGAQVKSAELSNDASRYGADQTRIASMYGADQNLAGIKDTNLTSTRNIGATGTEQRKTAAQADKFAVAKENRAAARSRAGSRRY